MRTILSALFLAALISRPSVASDKPDTKKPLVFGADVALVQIPVFVSGKGGAASTGLTEKDFVVDEDGKRVEIVSFRYVDTTRDDIQEEIRQSSAARRRFLLLFDKSFTDPLGLARARKAAKEFVLHGLAESDLAAVATFDFLRGVRLVANFTEDRRVLEHAIHTLGIPSLTKISDPLAIAGDFQATDLVRDRGSSGSDTPQELLAGVLAVLVQQMQAAEQQAYRSRVQVLVDSFNDLGSSLQRVPGRKQILYFSTGFNSTLLGGGDVVEQRRMSEAIVAGRIWEVDPAMRFGDSSFREEVAKSLLSLTRSDSVVHSIDVSGLGRPQDYGQRPLDAQPFRDAAGRESLALIAADTGGRFFTDANDIGQVLRETGDMTSRYYVLGVQPYGSKPDGSFRKLRVRVKPKGLRVSHRPGFFERSAEAGPVRPLERQFQAAELLLSGDDPTTTTSRLPFQVLIVPVPADAEKQSVGVVIQVPQGSLASGAGSLEMFGYALDRDGAVVDHFAHFLRVDTGSVGEDLLGLSFSGRFDVPPGDYTLKFLAQRSSGEASTRFFEVTVPKRQASQGFLLPPLFVERSKRWLSVDLKSREDAGLPLKIDLGTGSFLPRTEVTLRVGRREQLVLVSYDPKTARDPAVDIDIRSVLTDDSGRGFPAGAITVENVVHDADGRRLYVLGYTPEDIPPGDYTLRVHLGEANSVLQSYCRLKVLPRETATLR